MRWPALAFLVLLILVGPALSWPGESSPGRAGAVSSVVFYTSSGATTPQMPFWAAVDRGWPGGAKLETRFWKDLDDLRATILAGRGDVWLGHVDGLAQAALRGAPVSLVAVTAWKKFYVLSMDRVSGLDELASRLKTTGETLAVTPPDSPALAIMDDLARRGRTMPDLTRLIPNQLALDMMRGKVRHCLAPEPLVSLLLTRIPGLHVVASMEEEYARQAGGNGFLPVVGIAVHSDLLRDAPELVWSLVDAMQAAGTVLAGNHERALSFLPPETMRELGEDVIRRSLERDPIRVVAAGECRQEILDYLAVVLPDSLRTTELPPAFIPDRP